MYKTLTALREQDEISPYSGMLLLYTLQNLFFPESSIRNKQVTYIACKMWINSSASKWKRHLPVLRVLRMIHAQAQGNFNSGDAQ